ncbi:MAG: hypothetical protein V1800_04950 [Candidatus Latescibacterota bacterium]
MTIKTLDIIHHNHFDLGYTDHPTIALALQKRYIDLALDAIDATRDRKEGERFCWTAESLYPVHEWWQEANLGRKDRLIQAIHAGQFEVTAFPFNNTLFANEDQWDKLTNWIPEELWRRFGPRCAMQIDVNGISVAGMERAAQKGIEFLWVGPNTYLGRTPFDPPAVFDWKMPDGSKVLVWVNPVYGNGFGLFHTNWRQGPVPAASDLRYRPPQEGDFFPTSKGALLEAHRRCGEQLDLICSDGLIHPKHPGGDDGTSPLGGDIGFMSERLPVSVTNQWRMDNDPPFPPLADFVARWNEMGLTPVLRLTTPSVALQDLKEATRTPIRECSGEWIDWWTNGTASVPLEWAASRKAKRILTSLKSPFLGPFDEQACGKRDRILKDLCLFDEHTFGSCVSVGHPYSEAARGQAFEKGRYAYQALAHAEMLLADKMRALLKDAPRGIAVANTSHVPASGWVNLPANCLRGIYAAVRNLDTGLVGELAYLPGPEDFSGTPAEPEQVSSTNVSRTWPDLVPRQTVRFWSGSIPAHSIRHFELLDAGAGDQGSPAGSDRCASSSAHIETDPLGWPEKLTWNGMARSLIERGFGDFLSVGFAGLLPRAEYVGLFGTLDPASRKEKIAEFVRQETSQTMPAQGVAESPFTTTFDQRFDHPSLLWGIRRLEVWKEEPRARLSVTINRRSSMNPEVFYIRLPVPCGGTVPCIRNGGHVFKPGEGQIPGSCMDYYAIDDGVHYASEKGHWILSCKESALIAFDEPNPTVSLRASIRHPENLLAIVFDNTWNTNFSADSHGVMEFTYDLGWAKRLEHEAEAWEIAESLSSEFVVAVKV